MSSEVTIGIMDDQQIIASSLVSLISTFDFVDTVTLLKAPQCKKYRPPFDSYSLLIMDINMPFCNGFEISKIIKSRRPEQKIAMLTSQADSLSIHEAKSLSIEGYLIKNIGIEDLKKAIKKILEGGTYYHKLFSHSQDSYTFKDGTFVNITKRELQFLDLLMQELTTKEIADKMNISENTLIDYRRRLFHKFNVKNMVGLVKYALEIL